MHGWDVVLVLNALAGIDVGKDVVPPEAGCAIGGRGVTGGPICARPAVVAVEVVAQNVGVLERLPSLRNTSSCQEANFSRSNCTCQRVYSRRVRLLKRDWCQRSALCSLRRDPWHACGYVIGRNSWIGEECTVRGNADTPKLKDELMVWTEAGSALHTLVRSTESAQQGVRLDDDYNSRLPI